MKINGAELDTKNHESAGRLANILVKQIPENYLYSSDDVRLKSRSVRIKRNSTEIDVFFLSKKQPLTIDGYLFSFFMKMTTQFKLIVDKSIKKTYCKRINNMRTRVFIFLVIIWQNSI